MKLRTKEFFRGLLAVLLICCSAVGSFMVKDYLALKNPVNALPSIEVYYNGAPLPSKHVEMANYEWRFMFQRKTDGQEDLDFWVNGIEAAPTNASMPLKISFSFKCKDVKVSYFSEDEYQRSPNKNTYVFNEVTGDISTPLFPGEYTYRVEANWGWLGSVQYYFKVDVR